MTISRETFDAWRAPRFGTENPTRLDNPRWASLVHDRINAYQVNKRFGYERQWGTQPTWCFDRFGQTSTTLDDGRTIYIGGEHEDHYDPDFYIYNDVVVVGPDGTVAIVRFTEEDRRIAVMVEGRLSEERLCKLQEHVLGCLAALHFTAWELGK